MVLPVMRMYGGGWRQSTEAEFAEEDADEEVQAARGLDPLMVYDAEEVKRPLTKQRSCPMEFEGSAEQEAAHARRGPLFTDESLSMGG